MSDKKAPKIDKRFAEALYDPRFHRMKKNTQKVEIDKRFSSIITEKKKFDNTQSLYYLKKAQNPEKKKEDQNLSIEESSSSEEEKLSNEYFSEEEKILREEKSSNKLAVQNLDWNFLKSKEIYLLFESFVKILYPKLDVDKKLIKVELFISDFGKKQLEIENLEGPRKILEKATKKNKKLDLKVIRDYEKSRLNYYYAIIHFDKKFTAEKIYDNFDNFEIELSSCRMDLRFLPEDLDISKTPIEICEGLDENEKRNIPNFITKALGHSEIELSWDKPVNRNIEEMYGNDLDNINSEKINEIINVENNSEEEEDIEDLRKKLLGDQSDDIFADFKNKNQNQDISITFKVGFGEDITEKLNEENRGQTLNKREYFYKNKKTRKQLIEAAKYKKEERKEKYKKKQELELLIGDKKEKKAFEPNLNDERFGNIYKDPKFSIDPTDPKYKKELQKKFWNEKRNRKIRKYN